MNNFKSPSYLSWLIVLFLCTCSTDQQFNQKPNNIWILAEDMGADFSVYGRDIMQTPNIDTFAAEGAVYGNAFATSPVCSPSRSSLFTGMYATTFGAHQHRSLPGTIKIHLPDRVKTIRGLFRENRYAAINTGINFPTKSDNNFEYDENEMYTIAINNPQSRKKWDSFWRKAEDKPFFLQIQFKGGKVTHGPEVVNGEQVELLPYYPDNSLFREAFAT